MSNGPWHGWYSKKQANRLQIEPGEPRVYIYINKNGEQVKVTEVTPVAWSKFEENSDIPICSNNFDDSMYMGIVDRYYGSFINEMAKEPF